MLKSERQWWNLSDRERLVMLAIAFELTQVKCLEVMSDDVRSVSGLTERAFAQTVHILESKGLVSVTTDQWTMVRFAGDAVTAALVGYHKMRLVRREEGILLH